MLHTVGVLFPLFPCKKIDDDKCVLQMKIALPFSKAAAESVCNLKGATYKEGHKAALKGTLHLLSFVFRSFCYVF